MSPAMRVLPSGPILLDPVDARLVDRLQGDLPLSERPFADVGAELGIGEQEVIERLHDLLGQGVLTRFGPLFQIEPAGGAYLLAAIEVPPVDFDRVAACVNALPEVAHNYRREHRLNMWFVVAAESADAVERTCRQIEHATGLLVHRFPKEREYFIGLRLAATDAERGDGAV
jgi:DNA-binding Lrp family transcriptional regulator